MRLEGWTCVGGCSGIRIGDLSGTSGGGSSTICDFVGVVIFPCDDCCVWNVETLLLEIAECFVGSLVLFFGNATLDDSPLSVFFDNDWTDSGKFCSLWRCVCGEPFVDDETKILRKLFMYS